LDGFGALDRAAVSKNLRDKRMLFGIRGIGFFLGLLGQSFVVGSNPKHYRFCFGMRHIPRERANLLCAHPPKVRFVPICCGHL
jgi:hypothetical protein